MDTQVYLELLLRMQRTNVLDTYQSAMTSESKEDRSRQPKAGIGQVVSHGCAAGERQ